MNLSHDKDAIIHRLQTHISILEQQQNSQGYFSYETTSNIPEQFDEKTHLELNFIDTNSSTLEKLLQKREYELDQLRQQLNDIHQENEEKLQRINTEFNDYKIKYSSIEYQRNHLQQELQRLQNENDHLKSYINRLPSEIEYEKLRQSYEILQDQFKQSQQTNSEYRKEKKHLKKQLITYENLLNEQKQIIESNNNLSMNKSNLNAKSLTIDERIERDEKFNEFNRIIQQLKQDLHKEILNKKHHEHVNENNIQIVQSLTDNLTKKEQIIKENNLILRQNQQEIDELQIQLLVNQDEQKCLNERLLTNKELTLITQRVYSIIEKILLILDYSSQLLNNQSLSSHPDILMLQLSNHKNKSNINDNLLKCQISDVENLECKLDEIIDRLLSIRSELIARQFENDLQSNIPCQLQ